MAHPLFPPFFQKQQMATNQYDSKLLEISYNSSNERGSDKVIVHHHFDYYVQVFNI